MEEIIIRTFGGFDIFFDEKALSNMQARRGKMWTALKFLIAYHKRSVSINELIDVLWPDGDCPDPQSALKNMISRLRKILTGIFGDFQYISFSQGQYSWSPTIKFVMDTDEFERLLAEARDTDKNIADRIKAYEIGTSLYLGDFLRGESNEIWLMNFANYYRRSYLSAINELAELYERQASFEEAVNLYAGAIKVEPYEETLYEQQIRLLIYMGEYSLAREQYQSIERILKKEFDAKPSSALLNLRREIQQADEDPANDLLEIKNQLDNNLGNKTAIFCGPETFKRIYCYDRHLDERMQFPAFLAMLTIKPDTIPEGDKGLRSAMRILRRIIIQTLRQCDIVCQYSSNQFMLLLTATNEKNKMAPLLRIGRLFNRESGMESVVLDMQSLSMQEEGYAANF